MPEALGVILAGGRATRMGGVDKCLLELGDETLLARVMRRLVPQVDAMALNANGDPGRFAEFGLTVLPDPLPDFPGPLAGVLAGIDHAAEKGFAEIVTVAGDTPFFPETLVAGLRAAAEEAGTALALAATPDPERGIVRHPTFGLWPVALREDLRAALETGTRKVIAWTDPHGCATARFEAGAIDPFFNVNTPEDLAIARAHLAEAAE